MMLHLFFSAGPAGAQEAPVPEREAASVHWAYSSFLGTGFYRVAQDREVFVFDLPLSWSLRATDPDAEGLDRAGFELEIPVTLGIHRLDVFDDFLDLDNVGTISLTPGVTMEIPLRHNWVLGAYGHVGWGTELSGDEQAWIWDAGLKSRYALRNGSLDWGLFSELFHAGYDPRGGPRDSLSGFGVGLDFAHPVPWTAVDGTPLSLTWDLTYRWYGDPLTFTPSDRSAPETRVDDEWRVSFAVARLDGPIRVWFLEFDQLGLSYRFSSSGDFRGVTVNLSAPFDR